MVNKKLNIKNLKKYIYNKSNECVTALLSFISLTIDINSSKVVIITT